MKLAEVLFPYEKVREIQHELLEKSKECIEKKKNLIAHAPTGLGKTAAVLAPALAYALEKKKTVFFLTSRHTQHQIAIETLREVKKKHDPIFNAVDIIGKKWLCLQPGVTTLHSGEFAEYCRKMREDNLCDYYSNLKDKDKMSKRAGRAIANLQKVSPQVTEAITQESKAEKVCPYEISMHLSKDSEVIIADYFYMFNPKIRDTFLKRSSKELKDCIIIVDEAHNLPNRVKDLSTFRLSNIGLKRASSEARNQDKNELAAALSDMAALLEQYSCPEEAYVKKHDFMDKVNEIQDYDELTEELLEVGGKIREEQKRSYIAVVGEFLEAWKGEDKGFARILSRIPAAKGDILTLSYRCLDPSIITKDVIEAAHSTILMSGTLTPTSMYKELLGFEDAEEASFPNPFPTQNRLSMIIPKTSTKYDKRSETMYKEMAEILAKCINKIPGNSAVYFPSYYLKSSVNRYLETMAEKTTFDESPGMTNAEKHNFLEKFKKYKDTGATLLGVASGSFGEGIDLPGDYLKGVIIVGLPLQKPDLEAKALIDYYDAKFGKGWDYGYLFPAFNRALQSAGRCIRSETDRGVVIFLDERYTWNNYRRCFPSDWNPKVTMLYEKEIDDFFGKAT
ncbi:ATP-dependent DNA helicase [Nanoarchaeota archaeon]